jgi:ubiquinone/menaquinone biosynthesis C-methylase UbiE
VGFLPGAAGEQNHHILFLSIKQLLWELIIMGKKKEFNNIGALKNSLAGFIKGFSKRYIEKFYKSSLLLVDVQPEDRILEVGFGYGKFTKKLINRNPAFIGGIEDSELLVKNTFDRLKGVASEKTLLDLKNGTIEKIPYPENTFNKIITLNTPYFWKSHDQVLEETKRVLEPKGVFMILFYLKSPMEAVGIDQISYIKQWISDFLKKCREYGFSVVTEEMIVNKSCYGIKIKNNT